MTDQTKAGLEVVAWMGHSLRDGHMDFTTSRPSPSVMRDFNMQPLARQSDAAAIIAGKDAEIERLTKERDEALLIHQTDTGTASAVEALQATIAHQAERIAELEASLEIEKGQCELREEENRILFARMEAQSAALTKAQHTLRMVGQCLAWQVFGECRSYGEGVPLLKSHEADALCKEALSAIAQLDGAQAGEEVKPQNDAERVAE